MTQDDAFLQAILTEPDDDTPRLVYADWLDEHGDPARAEFIRVQIALAPLDRRDPDAEPLRRRAVELLREHQEAWQEGLPELPEGMSWGECRRGFIDEVYASRADELRALAGPILAAVPLRRLTLVCWDANESLAGSPLLGRVRELELLRNHHVHPAPPADDALLAAVLAWPETERLTHLDLRNLELSAVGVTPLVRAELPALTSLRWDVYTGEPPVSLEMILDARWLPRLERLELEYPRLTGGLASALCARLTPGRLRRLSLRRAYLTDADAADLAASGLLSGLGLLDLERNDIGPEGTRRLVAALAPTAMLALAENPVGDGGLQALADSPLLSRFGEIGRAWGEISDAGAIALARSPHAHRLAALYVPGGRLTSAGAAALLTSPHLTALKTVNLAGQRIESLPACRRDALERLYLGQNPLGAAGLTAFCAGSHLPKLEWLDLPSAQLGPEVARALADAPGLPGLKNLNVLGDAGVAALATGRGLPALEVLDLRNCGIGDGGLRAWLNSPRLGRLKQLQLASKGNPITDEAYEAFRDAALARGCDVDRRSQKPPPLCALRRGPAGGLLSPDDRRELTRWLGRLRFAEYHTVGWLKATTFRALSELIDTPRDRRLLDRYLRGEDVDDGLRREMIRLFVDESVMGSVPESVSAWEVRAATAFRPAGRDEALALVDDIIAASLEDGSALLGRMPRYVAADAPAAPVEEPDAEPEPIPYAQLRTWFADELFDRDAAAFYVHTVPGGPTVPFTHTRPRVLGMDRDVIALLWLE
jgi:uncharacterized protein (TIGR02996 family)